MSCVLLFVWKDTSNAGVARNHNVKMLYPYRNRNPNPIAITIAIGTTEMHIITRQGCRVCALPIKLLVFYSGYEPIRYYASSGTSLVRSGACGAVITNNKQRYCHSRESGNPAGVNRSSCIFWIPVFTGMTVVVIYKSNLQKIVSRATLSA